MVGLKLLQLRKVAKLPQRYLVTLLDKDNTTYSKFINGLFTLRKECIPLIEELYSIENASFANSGLA